MEHGKPHVVAARDRQPDSGDGLAWAVWGGGKARSSDEAG